MQAKDNPADLINMALEKLVKAQMELPGHSTLDEMTSTIRTEVNEDFFAAIVSRMDEVDRARLLEMLRVPAGDRSRFDELKRPAKAPTVSHLREPLAHLDRREALVATAMWLQGFRQGRWSTSPGRRRCWTPPRCASEETDRTNQVESLFGETAIPECWKPQIAPTTGRQRMRLPFPRVPCEAFPVWALAVWRNGRNLQMRLVTAEKNGSARRIETHTRSGQIFMVLASGDHQDFAITDLPLTEPVHFMTEQK
ncbi:hypothetical protein ACIQGO_42020 [Streptomyces shenzhenensis]|uniref:hypothetical protein n=1 Tax=Streptomyces shenzhenensis TaxID=943815 RepID=UPI003828CFDD